MFVLIHDPWCLNPESFCENGEWSGKIKGKFVNKEIYKAVMVRSSLKSSLLDKKIENFTGTLLQNYK